MYIYSMGYHTYEESDNIQLYHEKKFSKKKFEDIVTKATVNVLKEPEFKKDKHISFQDIIYDIAEELIKNFGFKEVKFTADFNIFGWANILDEEDWKRDRDAQLKLLTKAIQKLKKRRRN